MLPRSSFRVILPALLVTLSTISHAQTGTITGQVFDPSGAAVSGAQLRAVSDATGASTTVSTSSAGVYTFGALAPATYSITVLAPGFQDQTRKIVVDVGGTVPLRFNLSVGTANTSVDVSAVDLAPVETDSFQVSTVIDAKEITQLPLILRDPYQLTLLAPGVVSSTNNDGGFSVNGQRDRNNNFMLDGADNNDTSVPGGSGGLSSANPDSTQEFRVITNNFDAEFGRNTGAIIDVITRGGSNQFHGDAYEFGRYNALGARDFFNTKANGPQDPYVRNDFGASLGGPLWKDHTFFFLNGEAQRFRTTRTESTTTPTAAYRTGIFTYVDPTDGSQTPVNLTAANPNNISGYLLDPTVVKLLNLAPVGQADNGDGVTTTYFFPSPDALNSYTLTGRFDQKLTERHQLTVRYIYGHSNESDPFHDEVIAGYGQTAVLDTTHNGVVTIASTLSANMTNLFRGGYNQNNNGFFCNHAALDAAVGVDSFGNGRDITFPSFFNGNAFGCYDLGDSNGQARLSSTLLFGDTFSVVKGSHTIKFGGEFRDVKDNSYDNFFSRLSLTLDNYTNFTKPAYNFAGNPGSPSLLTFEDLVWGAQGVVSNIFENQFFDRAGNRRSSDLTRFVQREWDVFGQDTWKVTPKFTAILGLRYAFNGVPYEHDGNFSNFYGNSAGVTPTGGFAFTDVGPGGRQLYNNSWGLVEPRVGFAYDLHGDGKTAIRGGYGIFHDRVFDNVFGNVRANPPFQAQVNAYPFLDPTPSTLTTQGFPGALTPSATITDGDYFTPVTIDGNLKIPTSQSWNIGIQQQISGHLVLEVNYLGNHGTHGLREQDYAPPQPNLVAAALAAGVLPDALQNDSLYFGGADANGTSFNPLVNNTAFLHNLHQTSVVGSNYNSLQTRLQGQVGGLTLTASYSYSHALDDGADPLVQGAGGSGLPRNPFNLQDEYGNSDADTRHRGTVAAVYELPIGTTRPFLNHGLFGHVFEGIELSGIQQAQTGLPLDLRGTVDNLHTSVINRPQLVGAPYPNHRGQIVPAGKIVGPAQAAFANPAFGQDVSIRRNKFVGPAFVNTDVVFQKTQTLHEQVKLVFRAESYNVLNHPNMSAPLFQNLSIASSNFGISTGQVGQNDGTTGARQIQGALKVTF